MKQNIEKFSMQTTRDMCHRSCSKLNSRNIIIFIILIILLFVLLCK